MRVGLTAQALIFVLMDKMFMLQPGSAHRGAVWRTEGVIFGLLVTDQNHRCIIQTDTRLKDGVLLWLMFGTRMIHLMRSGGKIHQEEFLFRQMLMNCA